MLENNFNKWIYGLKGQLKMSNDNLISLLSHLQVVIQWAMSKPSRGITMLYLSDPSSSVVQFYLCVFSIRFWRNSHLAFFDNYLLRRDDRYIWITLSIRVLAVFFIYYYKLLWECCCWRLAVFSDDYYYYLRHHVLLFYCNIWKIFLP